MQFSFRVFLGAIMHHRKIAYFQAFKMYNGKKGRSFVSIDHQVRNLSTRGWKKKGPPLNPVIYALWFASEFLFFKFTTIEADNFRADEQKRYYGGLLQTFAQ